jgi:muconolactone delta-isomerase
MSATSIPVAAQTFVVVATIRDNTNFADMAALRADEEKRLEELQSDGRIGAHHIAAARRTVFLEVMAIDEDQVVETLAILPFHKFFDLDIYPTSAQT